MLFKDSKKFAINTITYVYNLFGTKAYAKQPEVWGASGDVTTKRSFI